MNNKYNSLVSNKRHLGKRSAIVNWRDQENLFYLVRKNRNAMYPGATYTTQSITRFNFIALLKKEKRKRQFQEQWKTKSSIDKGVYYFQSLKDTRIYEKVSFRYLGEMLKGFMPR